MDNIPAEQPLDSHRVDLCTLVIVYYPMPSLAGELSLSDQELKPLIDDSRLIGGIYNMAYDSCIIVSNDHWKEDAGGISRHCFLLATAADWNDPDSFTEDDAYAILLRVEGPEGLPSEDELMKVREEAMREIVINDTSEPGEVPGTSETIIDVLTKNEIQFSGIKAKILGTLYQEDGDLKFGSDVDTFYSSARYKVYKPREFALSKIGSFQIQDDAAGIRLGRIRYSSTERNELYENADVRVDIEDFIGSKTAVFGMTRTGKSNTMKIIATAVFEHAIKQGTDIGQLLFDPAGEYANPNVQDERALAELGEEAVTIYRWGDSYEEGIEANVESLKMNFFDEEYIEAVWTTIYQHVPSDAQYKKNFKAANVIGPAERSDNYSEYYRAQRRRAALYATLTEAGFSVPSDFSIPVQINKDVLAEVNRGVDEEDQYKTEGGTLYLNRSTLKEFWHQVADKRDDIEDVDADWVDNGLDAILGMLAQDAGSGYKILSTAKKYHDPRTEGYYAKKIYDDLADGKIVIVDMSTGTQSAIQMTSERIIRHVMQTAVDRFVGNKDLHDIQIYIEEAHQLFNRDHLEEAEDDDPYVRLAKEAAKFNIGLTYATQEVTGVDDRVLANTANWIVTHLNNKNETRQLSKYYNFEDFDRLTREAEDVGFARIKTKTGKYIIPTQIDLFDEERLIQAKRLHQQQTGE